MAENSPSSPASETWFLEVLEEVRRGVLPVANGDGETGSEGQRADGGLQGYVGVISARRNNVRATIRKQLDFLYDPSGGLPAVLKTYMGKRGIGGVLQYREDAEELAEILCTKALDIVKSQRARRYGPFIREVKNRMEHVRQSVRALDLPSREEGVAGNAERGEIRPGNCAMEGVSNASEPEEDLWEDPEMRRILVSDGLHAIIQPALETLRAELRASNSPIIGECEEMSDTDFGVCESFIRILQELVQTGNEKSKQTDDFEDIRGTLLQRLRREMLHLERDTPRKRPHTGLLPALQQCSTTITEALTASTEASLMSLQNSKVQGTKLDTGLLLLPATMAFLERRGQTGEAWQWSERDLNLFRKNFKLPESGPKVMEPFSEPSNNPLIAAADIVNSALRAGLRDSAGQQVILLSDAKTQVGRLREMHAERQLAEGMKGVVLRVKDVYAECVLHNLLAGVRKSLVGEGKVQALPGGRAVLLVGKEDFCMSWLSIVKRTVACSVDCCCREYEQTPRILQSVLRKQYVVRSRETLLELCTEVAKELGIEKIDSPILPPEEALNAGIDDPVSFFPYKSTCNLEQQVRDVLLQRGDEGEFPLHKGEREILVKALMKITNGGGMVAQRPTYASLLSVLQRSGQPLDVAAKQCNAAFHGGDNFRTPHGLLAQETLRILQDYPITHEPTTHEKQVAMEIVAEAHSGGKDAWRRVHQEINNRLYRGQPFRSQTFAKGLTTVVSDEWQKAPERQKPDLEHLAQVKEDQPFTEAGTGSVPRGVSEELQQEVRTDGQPELNRDQADVQLAALSQLQRLQRARVQEALQAIPCDAELADLEQALASLHVTVSHTSGSVLRTHDALETSHTEATRSAIRQKRVTVIDENFNPTFLLLSQFLRTLSEHEMALTKLVQCAEQCDGLLGQVDALRKKSETARMFFKHTLPTITAGMSPLLLGLLSESEVSACACEVPLQRLEKLKENISLLYEQCDETHEFEDSVKRTHLREELGDVLQEMCDLLRRPIGSEFTPPNTSMTSLPLAGDENSAGKDLEGEKPELEIFLKVQPFLGEHAQEILSAAFGIFCSSFCGKDGITAWHVRDLLKDVTPELDIPSGSMRKMTVDWPFFQALESVAAIHPSAMKAIELLNRGGKKEHLEKVRKVDLSAIDLNNDKHLLVLFLNTHGKLVFQPTAAGRKFATDHGMILSNDQVQTLLEHRQPSSTGRRSAASLRPRIVRHGGCSP